MLINSHSIDEHDDEPDPSEFEVTIECEFEDED